MRNVDNSGWSGARCKPSRLRQQLIRLAASLAQLWLQGLAQDQQFAVIGYESQAFLDALQTLFKRSVTLVLPGLLQ